ncbi:FtsX-like permease family protein [Roseicyclus marinus]|uniref:FtsX-like permease family protein n=1 Tax=Roseicyclus marinus TaxID=2161673 RepID=UPI00240EEF35|nr:ABC transporter permease [Roseicyclus marinus]MDG3041519.1 ABC transporter permease [Roseicyclus marinus]
MLYTALSTLFSHWRHHTGQLAALVMGLALATALWSGVQAINAEARDSYAEAAATLGQDRLSRLTGPNGGDVPLADYIALRRSGYLVSPVISGELRLGEARLRLLGIDPLTAPPEADPPALQDETLDLAAFFTNPGLILMTEETAGGPLPPGLPEIVISDTIPPSAAITDIGTASRLLGQTDPSYLLIAPSQPVGLPPLALATDLHLQPPDSAADIGRLTDSFHLNLTAFGLLSFAVGLFIVHAAIGLAFEQRRATVRTLRALGLPLRTILISFGVELAGLALFSGLIGLILGYAIAAALMPGVAGTLRGLYGAQIPGTLGFDPIWALSALGMTLAGAALAGAQALRRTAALPLLAPANPRAWATASGRAMRRQALVALLLFGAAIGLALWGGSLLSGFATLAALLVGAALILPATLGLILRLASKSVAGALGQWLFADTRQQLPGLSLALMALLLALAANIGVSTMVGSFRGTFVGWLDQRLAAELYVTVADSDEALRLRAFLGDRVDAILPIASVERPLAGRPGEVFGQADHPTFRENWPLLQAQPNAWDDLAAGEGVLINEQLARFADLDLGDALTLAPALTLPIVGVYSDYGNPAAQAILGLNRFTDMFPDAPQTRFALRLPPADVAGLATALREDFGLPTEAVVNQTQIKRFSLQVFEQTFRITGALNVLTLGVAAFALLTSLLTLAGMRLPQLAPVWALGLTRAQLARFELARSLILAALTFVLALPVGLCLAWVLLAVVNVEAFGWRLPMSIFPADWLRLFLLALGAAALAAALPAWRLARMPPTTLLKVFAHER